MLPVRPVDKFTPSWKLGHSYCCCPPREVFAWYLGQGKSWVHHWIVAFFYKGINVESAIPWSSWRLTRASRTLCNVRGFPIRFASASYTRRVVLTVVPQARIQIASCKLGATILVATQRFAQIDIKIAQRDPLPEIGQEFPRAKSGNCNQAAEAAGSSLLSRSRLHPRHPQQIARSCAICFTRNLHNVDEVLRGVFEFLAGWLLAPGIKTQSTFLPVVGISTITFCVGWRLDYVSELRVDHWASVCVELGGGGGAGKLPSSFWLNICWSPLPLSVVGGAQSPILLGDQEERVAWVPPVGAVGQNVVLEGL